MPPPAEVCALCSKVYCSTLPQTRALWNNCWPLPSLEAVVVAVWMDRKQTSGNFLINSQKCHSCLVPPPLLPWFPVMDGALTATDVLQNLLCSDFCMSFLVQSPPYIPVWLSVLLYCYNTCVCLWEGGVWIPLKWQLKQCVHCMICSIQEEAMAHKPTRQCDWHK